MGLKKCKTLVKIDLFKISHLELSLHHLNLVL